MKVSITLSELSISQAKDISGLVSVYAGVDSGPADIQSMPDIDPEVRKEMEAARAAEETPDETVAAEPKRKKRRTKAEMEAARAAEAEKTDPVAPPPEEEKTESTGRRRRRNRSRVAS